MSIVLVVLLVLTIIYFRARKQKPEEYPQWDPYDADVRNFYRKH